LPSFGADKPGFFQMHTARTGALAQCTPFLSKARAMPLLNPHSNQWRNVERVKIEACEHVGEDAYFVENRHCSVHHDHGLSSQMAKPAPASEDTKVEGFVAHGDANAPCELLEFAQNFFRRHSPTLPSELPSFRNSRFRVRSFQWKVASVGRIDDPPRTSANRR
jgi:hypothetical protein